MADEKIITSSVFEQGITEIMQDIANNLYEFEEYTEEEVADLMDLSEEEVAELTRVINDTTVALNKVYSNKKVEDLLSELEVTCNKYADEKIGGLANLHLAYVDSLPSVGEDNTIYILKSTTGNDTLNLYNNGWLSIGEFAVSLDNYYDKVEVDALLNDKANANEVVSQSDVVSDMSSVSSSTLLSTAGLEVELNKKVDKDSIAKVLDDTVTDDEVASAKTVFDSIINKKGECTTIENMNLDTVLKGGLYYVTSSCTNLPYDCLGGYMSVLYYDKVPNDYVNQTLFSWNGKKMYFRCLIGGTWSNWVIFNSSTVADVPKTDITFTDTTNYSPVSQCFYRVKNGICYVFVYVKCITPTVTDSIVYSSLPLPLNGTYYTAICGIRNTSFINCIVNGATGHLAFRGGIVNNDCIGNFSYPVAEE